MAASTAALTGASLVSPSHTQRSLLENGDVFRLLQLPENFIIGLDTVALTTSKTFHGFRDIPPGVHFIWAQQPGGVSRCGYWFVTGERGRLRVKEWDRYNEVLREPRRQVQVTDHNDDLGTVAQLLRPYVTQDQRNRPNVPIDNALPAWAQSPATVWDTLTTAISTQSLARITGKQGVEEFLVDLIDSARDVQPDEPNLSTSTTTTTNQLNFLFTQDFRDLRILDLRSSSTATTSEATDTSLRVQALLSPHEPKEKKQPHDEPNPNPESSLLAELQFTFLTGTHLGNPACLEQWWDLVLKIVLRAYDLALSHPKLVAGLLRTLHAQLLYTEYYLASPGEASGAGDGARAGAYAGGDEEGEGRGLSGDRPIFVHRPLNKWKLVRLLSGYRVQLDGLPRGGEVDGTARLEEVDEVFGELVGWLWRIDIDLRRDEGAQQAGGETGGGQDRDSEEDEDEQPVVVELDEEGREVGLVSFRD
ncbi:AAR2 protein-domain-containing protein [Dichotomopilus funicola]|uniref:AAR2 protein-domain-containing protein n=1 Tax=Dichotomopilus funicola TaxID=1934379 RepID=A0AAN6V8R5_9PEZI|nr:AAR2 protein-domain-containing protein [Dichotomopilus funicola]